MWGRESKRFNIGRSWKGNRPRQRGRKEEKCSSICKRKVFTSVQAFAYCSITKDKSTLEGSFCKIWTNYSKCSNMALTEQWIVTKVEVLFIEAIRQIHLKCAWAELLIDTELWTLCQTLMNSLQTHNFPQVKTEEAWSMRKKQNTLQIKIFSCLSCKKWIATGFPLSSAEHQDILFWL